MENQDDEYIQHFHALGFPKPPIKLLKNIIERLTKDFHEYLFSTIYKYERI
jgi:hypothetical protein